MNSRDRIAHNLAAALLAGVWTPSAMAARTAKLLGPSTRNDQRALVRQLLTLTDGSYPPSPHRLEAILLTSKHFEAASRPLQMSRAPLHAVLKPARFAPIPAFEDLDIPNIATIGDLARWLAISVEHLEWFADSRRQQGRTTIPILQHYSYAFQSKKSGPPRLIEQPKPRLKTVQRRILAEILSKLPSHPSAHGYVSGRSCLSGAKQHAGESVVVTADLKDFFLNTSIQRVHGIFRSLGYPWSVARLLTGLCTNCVPQVLFSRLPPAKRHDWTTRKTFETPHLPQGAPTSPALANFCANALDRRLAAYAARCGATYTRYADDLAFSGNEEFARRVEPFLAAVARITRDEGFILNAKKTRVMPRSTRQRITGLVVNDHLNVTRKDYDELKATLHNCRTLGPHEQNRAGAADFQAHLLGRVTWVEHVNPERGARLRRMFEEIVWESPPSPGPQVDQSGI